MLLDIVHIGHLQTLSLLHIFPCKFQKELAILKFVFILCFSSLAFVNGMSFENMEVLITPNHQIKLKPKENNKL